MRPSLEMGMALAVTSLLTLILLIAVLDPPGAGAWLHRWQSLVAGLLAFLGAALAFFAILKQIQVAEKHSVRAERLARSSVNQQRIRLLERLRDHSDFSALAADGDEGKDSLKEAWDRLALEDRNMEDSDYGSLYIVSCLGLLFSLACTLSTVAAAPGKEIGRLTSTSSRTKSWAPFIRQA